MSFDFNVKELWARLSGLGIKDIINTGISVADTGESKRSDLTQENGAQASETTQTRKRSPKSDVYTESESEDESEDEDEDDDEEGEDHSVPRAEVVPSPPHGSFGAQFLSQADPFPQKQTPVLQVPPTTPPSFSGDPRKNLQQAVLEQLKARVQATATKTEVVNDPYSTETVEPTATKTEVVNDPYSTETVEPKATSPEIEPAFSTVSAEVGEPKIVRFLIINGARKQGPPDHPFNVSFYKNSYSYDWETSDINSIAATLVDNISKIDQSDHTEFIPNILFQPRHASSPITVQWFDVDQTGDQTGRKLDDGMPTFETVTLAELVELFRPRFIVDLSPRTPEMHLTIDSLIKPNAAKFKIKKPGTQKLIEIYKLVGIKKYIKLEPANFCYDLTAGSQPVMLDPVMGYKYIFNRPEAGLCLSQLINFAKYFGVKIKIFDHSTPVQVTLVDKFESLNLGRAEFVEVYIFGKWVENTTAANFEPIERNNLTYVTTPNIAAAQVYDTIRKTGSVIKSNISLNVKKAMERQYISPLMFYFNGTTFELFEKKNSASIALSAVVQSIQKPLVIYDFSSFSSR